MEWHTEKRKLSDLKSLENNPRTITTEAFDQLTNDVDELGNFKPLIIDTDNTVIGGNQRLQALIKLGIEEVECSVPNKKLTAKQRKEIVILDNQHRGEFDIDVLANEYEDILKDLGYDDLLPADAIEVEEDDYDISETKETNVVLGDIWQLGNHRLMCGDSTNIDQVEKLMDGQKADMVFTDPPYGIGKLDIINDDKDFFVTIIDTTFNIKTLYSTRHSTLWIFGIFPEYLQWYIKALEYGLIPLQQSVFIKNVSREGLGERLMDIVEYAVQFGTLESPLYVVDIPFELQEFIMSNRSKELFREAEDDPTAWSRRFPNRNKKILKREQAGIKNAKNVFRLKTNVGFNNHKDIDTRTNQGLGLHPTQKPIPEICVLIQTSDSELVLDPFGGSGSTLIACEQLNRKCYMMEIDEYYTQVIIDRYIKLKGTDEDVYLLNDDGTKKSYRDITNERKK